MYNKVIMMGRIANALELKTTPGGIKVCTFRIAVDRHYKAKDKDRECDFFNIVAWRKSAEFVCNYFAKGRMIMIEGEMQTRQYTDKNGNPATWYEVVAERISFTGEPKAVDKTENPVAETAPPPPDEPPAFVGSEEPYPF